MSSRTEAVVRNGVILPVSESELQFQVEQVLAMEQVHGRLDLFRLNAGNFFVDKGTPRARMIRGCPKGTADFLIITSARTVTPEAMIAGPEEVRWGHATFLELKSTKGKQTPEQRAFEETIKARGCAYHVIRSLEELDVILADQVEGYRPLFPRRQK